MFVWSIQLIRQNFVGSILEYKHLGKSGLKVSPLCLGTMLFGRETPSQESQLIIESARSSGINFIDTADAYVGGDSERLVGRCIKTSRDHWVLATKLANKMGQGPNKGGLSRKWVMQACEESLRRLRTDYIDIYYLHKEDHATPLRETIMQQTGNITSKRQSTLQHLYNQAKDILIHTWEPELIKGTEVF